MSQGVRYMLIATLFYLFMNLGVKSLPDIPPVEMVFFRSIITLFITYYGLTRLQLHPFGTHKKLLITRGIAGFIGLVLFFITLQKIPLATAVTIQYTSPIFTALFGALFFGQIIFRWSWVFYAIAFSGVMVIKGLDSDIPTDMLLCGLGSAFASGIAYNIIAKLKGKEHPMVVVFYFPLITIPLSLPFLFQIWVTPQGWDWLVLLFIGIFTQIAQYFMTKAFQSDDFVNVTLVKYLGVIYSIVAGIFLFGEIPSSVTYLGIALVLLGVIGNLIYKTREQKKRTALSKS